MKQADLLDAGQYISMRVKVPSKSSTMRHRPAARIAEWIISFLLSAVATVAPFLNATYDESFGPARVAAVLAVVLALQVARRPRIQIGSEAMIYAGLLGYMSLSALWTPDFAVANNTLVPGCNCLLVLVLYGCLVKYQDCGAVLSGILFGFLFGAGNYTMATGFPLVRPKDFSYNAIAGMYLFGLYSVLVWGWYTRQRLLSLVMAVIAAMFVVATTSIKTNLGMLFGAFAAVSVYLGKFARLLRRGAVALLVVAALIGYLVVSNEALLGRVQDGADRVATGAQILIAREDNSQGTSFNDRIYWQKVGIAGWLGNPIFGSGVEAFRAKVGITSHSTPIDMLYNFGLIGFVLFYSIFAVLCWRLYQARGAQFGALPIIVLSAIVCYLFMSISEPLHYNTFFALVVAVSSGMLKRQSTRVRARDLCP